MPGMGEIVLAGIDWIWGTKCVRKAASLSYSAQRQIHVQTQIEKETAGIKKDIITHQTDENIRVQRETLDIKKQEIAYTTEQQLRVQSQSQQFRLQEIAYTTDEQLRLQSELHQFRLQEADHRHQLDLLRMEAQRRADIARELKQRFEQNSPFVDALETAWTMLFDEYQRTQRPLLLIAPFWDGTQTTAETDAGGSQFRTSVEDALRESAWEDDFTILDGYFRRPLRQTNRDIQVINDAVRDLPIAVVYGTLTKQEIRANIALWNMLPDAAPRQCVHIRGRARMPRDLGMEEGEAFQESLGRDLTLMVGQVGSVYHLFNAARHPRIASCLTGDGERDALMIELFQSYYDLHERANPGTLPLIRAARMQLFSEIHHEVGQRPHDDPAFQYQAGMKFLNGADGFPKDAKASLAWLNLAAGQGYAEAKKQLGKLSPEESVVTISAPSPRKGEDSRSNLAVAR